MATQMQLEIFWREIAWLTASCEAETMKESIKTCKLKSGNCFKSVLSKLLSLDYLSCPQNLEYRERERQSGKRESRRQASVDQLEKERQRGTVDEREIENEEDEFRWKNNMKMFYWR